MVAGAGRQEGRVTKKEPGEVTTKATSNSKERHQKSQQTKTKGQPQGSKNAHKQQMGQREDEKQTAQRKRMTEGSEQKNSVEQPTEGGQNRKANTKTGRGTTSNTKIAEFNNEGPNKGKTHVKPNTKNQGGREDPKQGKYVQTASPQMDQLPHPARIQAHKKAQRV